MASELLSVSWSNFYANRDFLSECQRKTKRHRPFFDAIHTIAISDIPTGTNGIMLEIGVGPAVCLVALNQLYDYRPWAIDSDLTMLKMAMDNISKYNIALLDRLVCASALTLPFERGAFKVAYSQGLLEHFSDESIGVIVNDVLRVAKIFVVSMPTVYFDLREHLKGDERLMTKDKWDEIFQSYNLIYSRYYSNHQEYLAILSGR